MGAPILKSLPVARGPFPFTDILSIELGCVTLSRMTFRSPSSYLLVLRTSLSFLLLCSISLRRGCTKLLVRLGLQLLFIVHSWSAWYFAFTAILLKGKAFVIKAEVDFCLQI